MPGFDSVDEPENLLLLCPLHHKPVDEKASVYAIEELEEWKARQIAHGIGVDLEQEEIEALARKLDALIDLLTRATMLELSCSLVSGGDSGFGGMIVVPFDATDKLRVGSAPLSISAIGVEVVNSGTLACQILRAGLEFDVGASEYVTWSLELNPITTTPLPHELGPHAAAQWLGTHPELAGCMVELARLRVLVQQFRAFCLTGGGRKEHSSWRPGYELPVFGDATSRQQYDELLARQRRPET